MTNKQQTEDDGLSDPSETERAPKSNEHVLCAELAWDALASGLYTFSSIARYVNAKTGCNHAHGWVKRNLRKQSKLVEELVDDGAISARAEYLQGLRNDLQKLAVVLNNPATITRDYLRAQRLAVEIRERIAAARGVATKREARETSNADEVPRTFNINFGTKRVDPEEAGLPEAVLDDEAIPEDDVQEPTDA